MNFKFWLVFRGETDRPVRLNFGTVIPRVLVEFVQFATVNIIIMTSKNQHI